MAKGLLWLLWQAAGLGPQRCLLVESLVKLQADTAPAAPHPIYISYEYTSFPLLKRITSAVRLLPNQDWPNQG